MNDSVLFDIVLRELNWAYDVDLCVEQLSLQFVTESSIWCELAMYAGDRSRADIGQYVEDICEVVPPEVMARLLYHLLCRHSVCVLLNRWGHVRVVSKDLIKSFSRNNNISVEIVLYLIVLVDIRNCSIHSEDVEGVAQIQLRDHVSEQLYKALRKFYLYEDATLLYLFVKKWAPCGWVHGWEFEDGYFESHYCMRDIPKHLPLQINTLD